MSALGANRTRRDGRNDVNDPNLREHSCDLPIGLSHRPRDGSVAEGKDISRPPASMAATNKCLAQSNKSGTGEAIKKRDAAHRAQPRHRQEAQARALPRARMTEHDMIKWFNAAPMGSRQQRMLWAAHEIARLTGATEGGVYQMLERSLERAGPQCSEISPSNG